MTVRVINAQHRTRVPLKHLSSLAQRAARRLGMSGAGQLAVTLIDAKQMRNVNRRFLRHDRTTDVISFRYDDEPVVGDILIDPGMARKYADDHGISYESELGRYIVHGLLHWLGHDDRTMAQRTRMRAKENEVLTACQWSTV